MPSCLSPPSCLKSEISNPKSLFVSCMLSKAPSLDSTKPRRVRGTPSGARSHADAAAGPQPFVSGLSPAATKQGSSRSRVLASEQPIEPSPRSKRSHVQERVPVTDYYSDSSKPCVGIDV